VTGKKINQKYNYFGWFRTHRNEGPPTWQLFNWGSLAFSEILFQDVRKSSIGGTNLFQNNSGALYNRTLGNRYQTQKNWEICLTAIAALEPHVSSFIYKRTTLRHLQAAFDRFIHLKRVRFGIFLNIPFVPSITPGGVIFWASKIKSRG